VKINLVKKQLDGKDRRVVKLDLMCVHCPLLAQQPDNLSAIILLYFF